MYEMRQWQRIRNTACVRIMVNLSYSWCSRIHSNDEKTGLVELLQHKTQTAETFSIKLKWLKSIDVNE